MWFVIAAALGGLVVLGSQRAGDFIDKVNWDPVWLGGSDPWGVKIYRSGSGGTSPGFKGWRVEIVLHGDFVHEKIWSGTVGKYMTEDHARKYAEKWIAEYRGPS